MRPIDADALPYSRIRIYHEAPDIPDGGFAGGYTAVVMSSVINNAPTLDTVPVIRCKDCKWYLSGVFCDLYFADRAADEYCSRAERAEE